MALAPSSPHARPPSLPPPPLFSPDLQGGPSGQELVSAVVLPCRGSGLSDWTSRIKSDDKTCPSKLGQSRGAPLIADCGGTPRTKAPRGSCRAIHRDRGPLFLQTRPRGCSWGKRRAASPRRPGVLGSSPSRCRQGRKQAVHSQAGGPATGARLRNVSEKWLCGPRTNSPRTGKVLLLAFWSPKAVHPPTPLGGGPHFRLQCPILSFPWALVAGHFFTCYYYCF